MQPNRQVYRAPIATMEAGVFVLDSKTMAQVGRTVSG
jgi:hypothetical protein